MQPLWVPVPGVDLAGGCEDGELQQSHPPGPKGLQAPQPCPALASPGPSPAPNEEQTNGCGGWCPKPGTTDEQPTNRSPSGATGPGVPLPLCTPNPITPAPRGEGTPTWYPGMSTGTPNPPLAQPWHGNPQRGHWHSPGTGTPMQPLAQTSQRDPQTPPFPSPATGTPKPTPAQPWHGDPDRWSLAVGAMWPALAAPISDASLNTGVPTPRGLAHPPVNSHTLVPAWAAPRGAHPSTRLPCSPSGAAGRVPRVPPPCSHACTGGAWQAAGAAAGDKQPLCLVPKGGSTGGCSRVERPKATELGPSTVNPPRHS